MNKSNVWVSSILKLPFTQNQSEPHPFTDEQVRAKAYELWQRRGAESSSEENWADAIEELTRKQYINRILKPVRRLWWKTGLEEPVQCIWKWTGIPEKKGWDFLQLLVAPLLLAIIASGLQAYLKDKDVKQQTADKDKEQLIAKNKAKQDRLLADDKAKQDTLIKYLDQMADSLKDGLLKTDKESEKFIIAQARTVTSLQSLDGKRQHLVIQFLRSAGLNEASDKTDTKKLGNHHMMLLYNAQMEKANLEKSDLSGAALRSANLRYAVLSGANLRSADFRGTHLEYANLSGADFGDTELGGAILYGADLSGAHFGDTDLSGADLSGSLLYGADLSGSVLHGTNLQRANLRGADLSGSLLYGADLRGADLDGAVLDGAVLDGAYLRGANLSGANLSGADFTDAKNLTITQVKSAKNWKQAKYNPEFRKKLGF